MVISFIAAQGIDRAIGRKGALPWRLPADHDHFWRTTRGHAFIMGRVSYEVPDALLSDYRNVILTSRRLTDLPEHTSTAANLEEALIGLHDEDEVFVLGGAEIFAAYLHRAVRMYLTHVETRVPDADAFFPPVDWTDWRLTARRRHPADDHHTCGFSICTYERK